MVGLHCSVLSFNFRFPQGKKKKKENWVGVHSQKQFTQTFLSYANWCSWKSNSSSKPHVFSTSWTGSVRKYKHPPTHTPKSYKCELFPFTGQAGINCFINLLTSSMRKWNSMFFCCCFVVCFCFVLFWGLQPSLPKHLWALTLYREEWNEDH